MPAVNRSTMKKPHSDSQNKINERNQLIQPKPKELPKQTQKKIRNAFQHSLKKSKLHFAAHSHHPWPDVTRAAHLKYWDLSAEQLDHKWDQVFGKTIPDAKSKLANLMGLSDPNQIVEGNNTQELVGRLISSFDLSKPFSILTTDSEFYSFDRMAKRLAEYPNVQITVVDTEPFATFTKRFCDAYKTQKFDLVFASLVFFNTGFYPITFLPELATVHRARTQNQRATVVLDGYHAFGAVPLNISEYEDDFYFVGGGYKYLSAGEGACFLTAPKSSILRPLYTGWMAEFHQLENQKKNSKNNRQLVTYPNSAARFIGSTSDPSAWFRFLAVQQWWKTVGLNPTSIRSHVLFLQEYFLTHFNPNWLSAIDGRWQFASENFERANFLTLHTPHAQNLTDRLAKQNVIVDCRGDNLRFGFGYYHQFHDVDLLFKKLSKLM
jgi:selenocysteine lyase/cysteine desulfurase